MEHNELKKCGFCGESIPANATRCPYCASILEIPVDDSYARAGDGVTDDQGLDQEQQNGFSTGSDQQYPADRQPGYQDPNTSNRPYYAEHRQSMMQNGGKAPLGNGLKVFLTLLFALLPGIGQLAGIITAIVFMSSSDDSDRRSFGSALLVANLILFILACLGCFVLALIGQRFAR
ncbi:MAG TPA: hypothetical protein PLG72_04465 [Clostridiales bacterium]|nr:hypothetical protein [Clostridiales bacterium]